MFMVSCMGIFTYKSLMSNVMSLWMSVISSFTKCLARLVEFVMLYCLLSAMCWVSFFVICFANLYVGAVLLFITGLIGIPLCSLSCALSTGGAGFFWVMYFIFRLSMIRWHCIVFCISFWYLFVGSLVNVLKLLAVRNWCTFCVVF